MISSQEFGGKQSDGKEITFESLVHSANKDFIGFLVLWYCGIIGETATWISMHTIEKYLKSYLLKNNPALDVEKYKHNITKLWKKYKEINPESEILRFSQVDDFVNDIATIDMDVRYGQCDLCSAPQYLYQFVILGSYLRYEILGKEKYESFYYGLSNLGIPMLYIENQQSIAERIVKKIMHIVLEHGLSITNSGNFVDNKKVMKLDFPPKIIAKKIAEAGCLVCDSLAKGQNRVQFDQRIFTEYYRNLK